MKKHNPKGKVIILRQTSGFLSLFADIFTAFFARKLQRVLHKIFHTLLVSTASRFYSALNMKAINIYNTYFEFEIKRKHRARSARKAFYLKSITQYIRCVYIFGDVFFRQKPLGKQQETTTQFYFVNE